MADHASGLAPELTPEEEAAFSPPTDDENPAIVDARKAFVITMWSAVLFVGAIVVFILF